MSMRVTWLRELVSIACVAGSAVPAFAGTVVVDTTPGLDLTGKFTAGWSFSQTFLAEGTNLASFGFDLKGYDATVRGLVFATDPLDPLRHTPIGPALFASPSFHILSAQDHEVVTFTTGGFELSPGSWYAVGLELIAVGDAPFYMYLVDGGDGAAGTGFSNFRTVPLGIPDGWGGADWAFRVTMDDAAVLTSVPLPASGSMGLGLLACVGTLAWARRRRSHFTPL